MNHKASEKSKRATIRAVLDQTELARKYLSVYNGELLTAAVPVDISDFVDSFLQLDVLSGNMSLNYIEAYVVYSQMYFVDEISGERFAINPGTIIVNKDIQLDTAFGRYLLAHESGHWINKRECPTSTRSYYSCSKNVIERVSIFDRDKIDDYINNDPDALLEIKADGLANSLLMPFDSFVPFVSSLMDEYGFSDHIIIDDNSSDKVLELVCNIASRYNVPEYAVRNHLYALGMYRVKETA